MGRIIEKMKKYDYIIVGSGLFGATFAYLARRQGKKCLVIDKRAHLGGNVYCESIEGINVHKYGPHIFHTNNKDLWNMVNDIVPFRRFVNCPVANYKGKLYNLPFNMNTFSQMWGVNTPDEARAKIDEQRAEMVERLKLDGAKEARNLEEQAILLVGRDIYERLIKGYTEKQWERDCKDLPPFLIKRLPVRFTYDNNYFNDMYQGIPAGGYNKLIEGLLEDVDTRTYCNFFDSFRNTWHDIADKLVFTGQMDEFFDYRFGRLDWRTVCFETEVINRPNYQGNAVVNYTERSVPYTRIIEHKHFEMMGHEVENCHKTVITKEYAKEYSAGMEPYYPVNDKKNTAIAEKYFELAKIEKDVIFGGRLAEYKYYDMAPVMERAIELSGYGKQ